MRGRLEVESDMRRGVIADNTLSLDLVSALAGDRSLTEAEKEVLADLEKIRGLRFFSDIFYSITHQYFAPEAAKPLWAKVLRHKHILSEALGRNVRIAVATLDYLSNITDHMESATLVGEVNYAEIIDLSLRDGLTRLFNHTYFYQQIDLEVKRFARYGAPISLVMLDVDDFKAVNDTYGHREGDRVLAEMGETLLRLARDSDICCRYGGEEFAVILPQTSVHEAGAIAERMRSELKQCLPDGRNVTVSVGVASCGKNTLTYEQLVEKADAALYRVKSSGKNRVDIAATEAE